MNESIIDSNNAQKQKDQHGIALFRIDLKSAKKNKVFDSNYICDICKQVMSILTKEPTMLKLKGPAIIVGDIHGDIKSLSFCINMFLSKIK